MHKKTELEIKIQLKLHFIFATELLHISLVFILTCDLIKIVITKKNMSESDLNFCSDSAPYTGVLHKAWISGSDWQCL